MNNADIVDTLINIESSAFTNDPTDAGGPTRWGITQATLAAHRGHPVTVQDVENLTEAEGRAIYEKNFVLPYNDVQPTELRWLVVDCSVQHNPVTAVRMLQRALGITDDGLLGKGTRDALQVQAYTWKVTFARILCERVLLYDALIVKRNDQIKYAKGWDANRINPFIMVLAKA